MCEEPARVSVSVYYSKDLLFGDATEEEIESEGIDWTACFREFERFVRDAIAVPQHDYTVEIHCLRSREWERLAANRPTTSDANIFIADAQPLPLVSDAFDVQITGPISRDECLDAQTDKVFGLHLVLEDRLWFVCHDWYWVKSGPLDETDDYEWRRAEEDGELDDVPF